MSSKSKTEKLAARGVKSGSAANTRILSVGADDPPARRKLSGLCYAVAPKQPNAQFGCASDENLVQTCASQRQPRSGLETRLDRSAVAKKADAAKRKSVAAGKLNAKPSQD